MIEIISGIIAVLLIVIAILLYIFLKKLPPGKPESPGQSIGLLQNQITALNDSLNRRFGESSTMVSESLKQSNELIRHITEKLTRLDETNKQVMGFTEQLQSLQDILKNPKQRGVLGEYYLETVLKNVLPPGSYQMQYKFSDNSRVDAVIFVKDKIIPVDSKFSLENYEKMLNASGIAERKAFEKIFISDVKTRIQETSLYVKEAENTLNFAFMFIPSESIYYDLLINRVGDLDLIEYAFKEKHVVLVSPTSFLAYLQTVLQGLRALQIEESARDIIVSVSKLKKHLDAYDSDMQKLGQNIGTVVTTYNHAYKELRKVDKDITKITGEESVIEPLLLEKPSDSDNEE